MNKSLEGSKEQARLPPIQRGAHPWSWDERMQSWCDELHF
jgi:hypothetical protein